MQAGSYPSKAKLSSRAVLALLLLMWLVYTGLFVLYLPEPYASMVGFIPGLVGVGALLAAGFSTKAYYLDLSALSSKGLMVLLLLFVPMIPVVLAGFQQAGWGGWDWVTALVYAPASGIAQELYFRSALLPGLERALGQRGLALWLSSILFSLFHVGMFSVAPFWGAVAGLMVTFVVGLGWGWQVQHDRSVVWAMAHHSLLQIVLRLFAWM